MYPKLQSYIDDLEELGHKIPNQRKQILAEVVDNIRSKKLAQLIFICTHNSRRSHLCQIWAATLAKHFGLEGIETYSGGTEATAFNPRAVAAIQRAGFEVENPGGDNPHYKVYVDKESEPMVCYSKTFDDSANPNENFAAIMTCSDADQNCPIVPGAEKRFSIPYKDPKESDGSSREKETYDERCRQIATEMYYMLSQLN